MIFNIFVGSSLSNKELIKKSNIFFDSYKKYKRSNLTIFAPQNDNYTISIFNKRIKITVVDNEINVKGKSSIYDYIETVLDNKTVLVRGSDEFDYALLSEIKNVNITRI